jgi:hypothetical protein
MKNRGEDLLGHPGAELENSFLVVGRTEGSQEISYRHASVRTRAKLSLGSLQPRNLSVIAGSVSCQAMRIVGRELMEGT